MSKKRPQNSTICVAEKEPFSSKVRPEHCVNSGRTAVLRCVESIVMMLGPAVTWSYKIAALISSVNVLFTVTPASSARVVPNAFKQDD